jgi:hypothetical protein
MDDDGIEKRDRQKNKRQWILDQKIEQPHFTPLGETFKNFGYATTKQRECAR